jgi:hypothetical protein
VIDEVSAFPRKTAAFVRAIPSLDRTRHPPVQRTVLLRRSVGQLRGDVLGCETERQTSGVVPVLAALLPGAPGRLLKDTGFPVRTRLPYGYTRLSEDW